MYCDKYSEFNILISMHEKFWYITYTVFGILEMLCFNKPFLEPISAHKKFQDFVRCTIRISEIPTPYFALILQ